MVLMDFGVGRVGSGVDVCRGKESLAMVLMYVGVGRVWQSC